MALQTFTVTLNRAHKIASRLGGLTQDVVRAMESQVQPVTVSLQSPHIVATKVQERASAFNVLYEKFQRLSKANRLVRESIGKANGQAGVSDLLAEQVYLAVHLRALTSISQNMARDALEVSEVPGDSTPDQYGRHQSVSVHALSRERRNELLVEQDDMQARAHGVADKIADANRYQVTFELEADLAKAVGL